MVALIEYNLGALCNPSPVGGVAGKVDCEVAPQLAKIPGISQVAAPVRSADGSRWLIDATLAVPVESAAARAVVHQIQAAAHL